MPVKELAKKHGGTAASSGVGAIIVYVIMQLFPNGFNASQASPSLTKDDVKAVVTECVAKDYATKEYVDRECLRMKELLNEKFNSIDGKLELLIRYSSNNRMHGDTGKNRPKIAVTPDVKKSTYMAEVMDE